MQDLIKTIEKKEHLLKINKASTFDIISSQKKLVKNNIPKIPKELIEFLKIYNGIGYDDGYIYGIDVDKDILPNIIDKNLKLKNQSEYIIFGENTFDYLVYNEKKSLYQIIDKSDYEVIKEYKELSRAILYIIKI